MESMYFRFRSIVWLVSIVLANIPAPIDAQVHTKQGNLFHEDRCSLVEERYRVIVSTDIGGTDPDDFQSMVHLFAYADVLDLEGLISSPYGPGRKEHILEVIDCYEKDFDRWKSRSSRYPIPQTLRAMTKQGETESAPYRGIRKSTEGSKWIVECARRVESRPLYVLVWGGIEDLAQSLHDAPDIAPKLKVFYIGGPNKKWGPNAYQYIVEHHPDLWIIESNATYRGWFTGGEQSGPWSNREFVKRFVTGKGALGDLFVAKLDTLKMGDSPSVGWLLSGNPEDPAQPSWGGRYVRTASRPCKSFGRLTNIEDTISVFGIVELRLPLAPNELDTLHAEMRIENQVLPGYKMDDGTLRFRFCPKGTGVYHYSLRSNSPIFDGKLGSITATNPEPSEIHADFARHPNWWTDDLSPAFAEGNHFGAKTVSRHRMEYLKDFAERLAH